MFYYWLENGGYPTGKRKGDDPLIYQEGFSPPHWRLQLTAEGGAIILKPKRIVTAEDIKGIIGPIEVEIEEVEEALGRDNP